MSNWIPQPSSRGTLGRTLAWEYDDLWRLKKETITADPAGKNGQSLWSYDAVGNRTNQGSTIAGVPVQAPAFDDNDRLEEHGTDANGNTTAADGALYTWSHEDRLLSKTGANGSNVSLAYDGDGNLVRKTVGGVVTSYLVDELNHTGYTQVVEELTNGVVTKVYTYGHDLISVDSNADGNGTFEARFYGYDGFASVRYLIDTVGAITESYDHDARGNLLHTSF